MDDAPDTVRVPERDVECEPAAEGEPDERRAVDADCVEHADRVVARAPLVGWGLAAPVEAEVVADAAERISERVRWVLPQPAVAEPTVQEEHCRPVALLLDPEACAVDVDVRDTATIASAAMALEHVLVV